MVIIIFVRNIIFIMAILYVKKWTNVQLLTAAVVLTLTASIQMEALAAAAELVTMETDFSASVRLSISNVSIAQNHIVICHTAFPFSSDSHLIHISKYKSD